MISPQDLCAAHTDLASTRFLPRDPIMAEEEEGDEGQQGVRAVKVSLSYVARAAGIRRYLDEEFLQRASQVREESVQRAQRPL